MYFKWAIQSDNGVEWCFLATWTEIMLKNIMFQDDPVNGLVQSVSKRQLGLVTYRMHLSMLYPNP